MNIKKKTAQFRERIASLPREDILELIELQDHELIIQIQRIEWVFRNKLSHLTWDDGTPIEGRDFSNEELALLVDEPFEYSTELAELGLGLEEQKQLHLAKDPVTWAKHFLRVDGGPVTPRVYQILMLRHPNRFKVLRAGRRLGKTFSMALLLLWYSYTTKNGRAIVLTPMQAQANLIYEEILKLVAESPIVTESITRSVASPPAEIDFKNGSTIRFFTSGMKSGGRCLTPDHDVLTRDGWKSIVDISVGEDIVAWKFPEDEGRQGQLYWGTVSDTWAYDYQGPMLTHDTPHLSFKVTPNHKFPSRSRHPNSDWKWREAQDFKENIEIPYTGNEVIADKEDYSGDEMEMWGWWLSEGSGFDKRMARISQVKPEGRKQLIDDFLAKSNFKYTVYEREVRVKWQPPEYCGKYFDTKFIPRSLFYQKHRDRLLKGLVNGDGWKRRDGWEYYSGSEQLANDVQELATLMGFITYLKLKRTWDYKSYNSDGSKKYTPCWVVSAYPNRKTAHTSKWNKGMSWEDYDGKVHCLTVPESGAFLVRHNGRIHITGNSDATRGQEAHLIVLDELDYMGDEDLEAVLAMMQKTSANQPEKILIGASTPTGKRGQFWDWCHNPARFKEFWFPSYCNPHWTQEDEDFLRAEHKTEMGYRHEVEADWGELTEGVYPRKLLDHAFNALPEWKYLPGLTSTHSRYVIGVDWDKYGAGTNIVVLEIFDDRHPEEHMRGKVKVCFREETTREEYSLLKAVDRIVELNQTFRPDHIYVDRGYGDVQVELLHKHGVDFPESKLSERVKGIQFGQSIEVRDPFTMQKVKKEIKPFMVSNLREMLEQDKIYFPKHDELLYDQLSHYVVSKTTATGRPVYEMANSDLGDHAHDALMLAALAVTENYNKLFKANYATKTRAVSNSTFLQNMPLSPNPAKAEAEKKQAEKEYGSATAAPIQIKRPMTGNIRGGRRAIRRKMF